MQCALIILAFEKAEMELKKKGVLKPSKIQKATLLSDYLEQDKEIRLGEKSLRIYYNKAIDNQEVNIGKLKVTDRLCGYLGYDNYSDFILLNEVMNAKKGEVENEKKGKSKIARRKGMIISISIIASLIGYLGYKSVEENCMIWDGIQYEKVKCDGVYSGSVLHYNDQTFHSFKRIARENLTVDYPYFKANKSPNLWYGKSSDGTYEYFTSLGFHPETGKTLKKITVYMIRKNICPEY